MQLIVLGMHRSGTSVLARVLNLMGAYFAPEGVSTGANKENPKGFWERRDVRNINDAVLHGMGCDWNRVSRFNAAAIPDPVVSEFKKNASRVILDMDAHRPWFLKEPRLCLLFSLWRQQLEMPVCIHILRHPVEVASSLHKRNGIPIDAGLELWEFYHRHARHASAGLPAITVSHRSLMENPAKAVDSLHHSLCELGVQGLRKPSPLEVSAFVQPELFRERDTREDLLPYKDAPQVGLFQNFLDGKMSGAERSGRLPRIRTKALTHYESTLPPLATSPLEADSPVTLRNKLEERDRQIQGIAETLLTLTKDVKLRQEQGLQQKEFLEQLRSGLSSRAEHDARQLQLVAESNELLKRQGARISTLEHDLAMARETEDALRIENATAKSRVAALQEQLVRLDAVRLDEQSTLTARLGEVERQSERNLQAREATIDELQTALEHSNSRLRQADVTRLDLENHLNQCYCRIASLSASLADSLGTSAPAGPGPDEISH